MLRRMSIDTFITHRNRIFQNNLKYGEALWAYRMNGRRLFARSTCLAFPFCYKSRTWLPIISFIFGRSIFLFMTLQATLPVVESMFNRLFPSSTPFNIPNVKPKRPTTSFGTSLARYAELCPEGGCNKLIEPQTAELYDR